MPGWHARGVLPTALLLTVRTPPAADRQRRQRAQASGGSVFEFAEVPFEVRRELVESRVRLWRRRPLFSFASATGKGMDGTWSRPHPAVHAIRRLRPGRHWTMALLAAERHA